MNFSIPETYEKGSMKRIRHSFDLQKKKKNILDHLRHRTSHEIQLRICKELILPAFDHAGL